MAKAIKRQPPNPTDELWRSLGQVTSDHKKRHNVDHLLDLLEQNAKRIIGEAPNDAALIASRAVLAYVEQARAGDMAAAIQAERHNWRAEWHEKGTTEALIVAAERVVRWRGVVINCGDSSQHWQILDKIGEADEIYICELRKLVKPSGLAECLRKINRRIKYAGSPYRLAKRGEKVIVKKAEK